MGESKKNTTYKWCITLKGVVPIGGIDVIQTNGDKICEIGFTLSKAYWNRGIMTEATRVVLVCLL
ncbi:MAG: GNAT family N-acetyltransferase [Oscillospiraceae bacterium]|nr:GNAT family N-acetyltransferase [Oscillospiraceae bacterium]